MTLAPQNVSLPAASESGDLRATLQALRDILADSVENAPVDKRAPLAKELREVLRELETLPSLKESPLDELRNRRDARRGAGAENSKGAAGTK